MNKNRPMPPMGKGAPVPPEGKGGAMPPKGPPPMNFKVLKRLISLLFKDYPGKISVIFACIIINAIIGVTPAVYIETITSYILVGLENGWDAVKGDILSSVLMPLENLNLVICLFQIVTQNLESLIKVLE